MLNVQLISIVSGKLFRNVGEKGILYQFQEIWKVGYIMSELQSV